MSFSLSIQTARVNTLAVLARCIVPMLVTASLLSPSYAQSTPSVSSRVQVSPTKQTADAAAKDAAQNPVAAAISVPFQNNTYYGVGPYRRAENAFLAEPIVPFKLSSKWILITRTIIPVVVVPRLSSTEGVDYGLGNIQPQFYLSPSHTGTFIWGLGGQLYLPTATDKVLGINKWGGGPAAVGLIRKGHWLGGSLIGNQFAGLNHKHVNEMTINPFLFYNLKHGWYLFSSPVITADWTSPRNNRWIAPVGGGFGRVFRIGRQPLNARTEFLNDVQTIDGGPDWQLQTQLQFVFLRGKK